MWTELALAAGVSTITLGAAYLSERVHVGQMAA